MKALIKKTLILASALYVTATVNATTPSEFNTLCKSDDNIATVQRIIREEPGLINQTAVVGGIVEPIFSTPLITAISKYATQIAHALIQFGADIHVQDSMGETPLSTAIYYGTPTILQELINKNVYIPRRFNSGIISEGRTPLELAESGSILARGERLRQDVRDVINILRNYYRRQVEVQPQAALAQPAQAPQAGQRRERDGVAAVEQIVQPAPVVQTVPAPPTVLTP